MAIIFKPLGLGWFAWRFRRGAMQIPPLRCGMTSRWVLWRGVWVPGLVLVEPVTGWPVSGCQLSVLPLLLSVLPLLLLSVVPLFLLYQVGGVEHVFHFGAVKRCE